MRSISPPSRSTWRIVALVGVAALLVVPGLAGASRGGDPSSERAAVRAKRAQVSSQIDVLKASDAQIDAALADLQANVAGQQARVDEARRAAQQAEEALAAATAAVEAKQAEIAGLRGQIREFAIDAFIHPPADDAMQALDAEDPSDSARKRALLELQNQSDADLLDRLDAAQEDLAVEQARAAEAKDAADAKAAEVESRLAELTSARDQQVEFSAQVEARLARALGEAAGLEKLDASLSAKIAAQQAALAARAGVRGGSRGGSAVSYNGTLATVSCPTGGSITVDDSIASNVQGLLNAAPDSIRLCGWGWRSSQRQQELWDEHNCDVRCTVPTARPGTSMHERGLAIDFTSGGSSIGSRSSAAFQWMSANAGRYGLHNLPSEPWHWSVNGN